MKNDILKTLIKSTIIELILSSLEVKVLLG